MSVSGIVRRMDELGRIVIPKELRRTMRLREGDEMEIFSEGESLVVRKHSRFEGFRRAAEKAVTLAASVTGCEVFVVAADRVAAAAGARRKEIAARRISEECARAVSGREAKCMNFEGGFSPVDGIEFAARSVVSVPMFSAGDVTGWLVAAGENAEKWKGYLEFAAGVLESVCAE